MCIRDSPWIIDIHARAVAFEFPDEVDDARIPQVRAIFLEGHAEDQDPAAPDGMALPDHELDHLACHMAAHCIVDAPAGQQDVREVADRLGLLDQVVRIHADAMATDEAGLERKEIPLGPGCGQYIGRIDAEAVENKGEFIDQCDVGIALGILDDLGRLGDLE